MKLKDLLQVCPNARIELHSSFDGKLVATKHESLLNFSEVEVLSIYPQIKTGRDNDYAYPMLYVFGDSTDINRIKRGGCHGQE